MQFCTKCGTPLGNGMDFCPNCGASVNGVPSQVDMAVVPTRVKKKHVVLVSLLIITAIFAMWFFLGRSSASIIGNWELVEMEGVPQSDFRQWRNSVGGAPIELDFYDDGTGFLLRRGMDGSDGDEAEAFHWLIDGNTITMQRGDGWTVWDEVGVTYFNLSASRLEMTHHVYWDAENYHSIHIIFERIN